MDYNTMIDLGIHDKVHRCERCNEKLNPKKIVWLELSQTNGYYYEYDHLPEGHISQGGFVFGSICAKNELIETTQKTKPQLS